MYFSLPLFLDRWNPWTGRWKWIRKPKILSCWEETSHSILIHVFLLAILLLHFKVSGLHLQSKPWEFLIHLGPHAHHPLCFSVTCSVKQSFFRKVLVLELKAEPHSSAINNPFSYSLTTWKQVNLACDSQEPWNLIMALIYSLMNGSVIMSWSDFRGIAC